MPIASTILAAALLAQANNQVPTNTCLVEALNPATLVHLQMSKLPGPRERTEQNKLFASDLVLASNGGKVLGYTRIGISYRPCGGLRDLSKERRNGLKRFFFGKDAKKLLNLKIQVQPLDVGATKPLASIKRNSNKQTESWDTAIVNDEVLLPYFRVDRSSTVAIEVTLRSDRTYNSSIAGSTLDIVQRAAALINPATTLITKENKERFNSASTFVDGAVNGMLAASIDEKANSRVPLNLPQDRQTLAIITLNVPMANNTFASAQSPSQQVGQWVVYAEHYRPSMMADLEQTTPIPVTQIAAASVLNYLVADKKTLREALGASKGLTAARDALVAATDPKDVTNKARTLCRAVVVEADTIGLAPIDSGAAAWAYLKDLSFTTEKQGAAETGCGEIEHYPTAS